MAFRRAGMLAMLLGWSLISITGIAWTAPIEEPRTAAPDRTGVPGERRGAALERASGAAAPGAELAAADPPGTTVTLIWTTTGDDGVVGVASYFDLRYSTQPITESNFYFASMVLDVAPPLDPGIPQVAVVRNLLPYLNYYFAIKTADERGNWSPISNIAFWSTSSTVSAGDRPVRLAFSSPVPNPSRHSTRFELSLPQAAPVRVEAFDLGGRRVRSLLDGHREAGDADVIWDLRDDQGLPVRAGIYLVRAVLPGKVVTRRTVVVR